MDMGFDLGGFDLEVGLVVSDQQKMACRPAAARRHTIDTGRPAAANATLCAFSPIGK
jgi:hypothetical protein